MFACFDTFTKTDPFEPSTENDPTGGPHLSRPTRELFYVLQVRVLKEIANFQHLDDAGWPPRGPYTSCSKTTKAPKNHMKVSTSIELGPKLTF